MVMMSLKKKSSQSLSLSPPVYLYLGGKESRPTTAQPCLKAGQGTQDTQH